MSKPSKPKTTPVPAIPELADADLIGLDTELTPAERLAGWIEARVLPQNIRGVRFQLRQQSAEGQSLVQEWAPDEGQDADGIAAMLYAEAEADAEGTDGVLGYVVWAVDPANNHVAARFLFRLAADPLRDASVSFAAGDVVRLKTGGPDMTVEDAGLLLVRCVWFNRDGDLRRESFPPDALRDQHLGMS